MESDNSRRYITLYVSISVALISWSIYDALEGSANWFAFIIEISNGYKLGILFNFIVLVLFAITRGLSRLIFGELRLIEVEHLSTKIPFFLISLLLNLKDSDVDILLNCFSLWLIVGIRMLQVVLLDRFDYLNIQISNSIAEADLTKREKILLYLKTSYFWLFFVLISMEATFTYFFVFDVFGGINTIAYLLLGFQVAVQSVDTIAYLLKVFLSIYEILFYQSQGSSFSLDDFDETSDAEEVDQEELEWENKSLYTKYIDVGAALLSTLSYITFTRLAYINSAGFPLAMVQGTFSSMRNSFKEIKQLLVFLRAAKQLESYLPNASTSDLNNSDRLCIICREDMKSSEECAVIHKKLSKRKQPKKLTCGHILHMGCLKDWLERSDACPLCRKKVLQHWNENTNIRPQEENVQEAAINLPVNENHDIVDDLNGNDQDTDSQNRGTIDTADAAENIDNTVGNVSFHSSQSAISSDKGQYQDFKTNAVVPTDWIILPIHKKSENSYEVDFAQNLKGTLTVSKSRKDRELRTLTPNNFSGDNEYI